MSEPGYNGVYAVTILAIPVAYATNTFAYSFSEYFDISVALTLAGVIALIFVCQITRLFIGRQGNPLFYALLLGCFASVSSLMIALENDNIQNGLMTTFLRHGQPKLTSHHATAACYWDGIVHFVMYLIMTAALAWNENFRELGLFWVGSICNSLLVIMSGVLYDWRLINWTCLLYLPYIVLVLYTAHYFLTSPPVEPSKEEVKLNQLYDSREKTPPVLPTKRTDFRDRPEDIFFLTAFLTSSVIVLLQSSVLLSLPITDDYLNNYKPYHESIPFPKIQTLVYLFCYVPYYAFVCLVLIGRKTKWMNDSSLIFAGASLQAAVVHIVSSLRQLNSSDYLQTIIICAVHTILFIIVPQCFAVRCHREPRDFLPAVRRRRYVGRHTLKKPSALEIGSEVQQEAQALAVQLRSYASQFENAEPHVPVKAAIAATEITTENVACNSPEILPSPLDSKSHEVSAPVVDTKSEDGLIGTAAENDTIISQQETPVVEPQPTEDVWLELIKNDDNELEQLTENEDTPSREVDDNTPAPTITAPAQLIEPLPLPTLQTPITRFAQRSAMRPALRKRDPSPSAIPKLLDAKRYKQDSEVAVAPTKPVRRASLRFDLPEVNTPSHRAANCKVQRYSPVGRFGNRQIEKQEDGREDGDGENKENSEVVSTDDVLPDNKQESEMNIPQTPVVSRQRTIKAPWSWSSGRTITMSIGDSASDAEDMHPLRRRAPSLSPTRLKTPTPRPRTQSLPADSRAPEVQLEVESDQSDVTTDQEPVSTTESN